MDTEEFQFVTVWSLPKGYSTDDVFTFLGDKFPIVRKGRTNVSLAVPKKQATKLCQSKNSQIFNGEHIIGVMFDKAPEPVKEKSKPPPISTSVPTGKTSPPSHAQRLVEKANEPASVGSPRPDIGSSSGGIFSPRPGAAPAPTTFADSFAADSKAKNESSNAQQKDLNKIKGMPKVGRVTLRLNGQRTEFVVQVFPDRLFILVLQIDKISHINNIGFDQLRAKMGIDRNDITTVLGGESPFADFLARQIVRKIAKRDRPLVLATGFPRNVNNDIGTSIIDTVVKLVNQLI